MIHLKDKIYGMIVGCALGDILGSAQTQLEHRYRIQYIITQPADLLPFGIRPGHWTENTATFLALLSALLGCTDPLESYREILYQGKYSNSPVYLDIETVHACTDIVSEHIHNPCSLVRTGAVSLYYFNSYDRLLNEAHANSALTHKCLVCADACKLFSSIIDCALHGRSKKEILSVEYYGNLQLSVELWALLTDLTTPTPDSHLELNSSQVILYQVLHYFKISNNFKEGLVMILASNAAYKNYIGTLYGQLAGAYYGLTDVEEDWLDDLNGEYFADLAERCFVGAHGERG